MAENIRVGWIGTGVMGAPMAGHLLTAGYPVTVYNRTKAKADGLLKRGASWADSPAAVARESDIVFAIVGMPPDVRASHEVSALAAYGCPTQMHVIRLLCPPLAGEDHAKDIDFSPLGIRTRWEAGYAHTARVLEQSPWTACVDPMEGIVLHEAEAGLMTEGTPA